MVSVIVSAFNVEKYISQALESVLAQSYSRIELIVVNDGSTDGTARVLERFHAKPGIRCLYQPNGGSASARNAGARVARGEFLAFLDGDDVATPRRVVAPVEALLRHPDHPLAYGRIDLIDDRGAWLASRNNRARYRSGWVAKQLRYRNFIPFSTITIRRDVFWDLGGFDESIRSSEDWEFLFRLATCHPIAFVDECLVLYRVRPGSKTMDVHAKELAYRAVQQKIFCALPAGTPPRHSLPRLADACRWMGLGAILMKRGEIRRAFRFFLRAVRCHAGVLFVFRSEISDGLRRIVLGNSVRAQTEMNPRPKI